MMERKINLKHLTKIEGHARLYIEIKKSIVKKVELDIFEGARFFEGILVGKKWNELAPVTSRICGICSVAHTLAALNAIEKAFEVVISEQTQKMRELLSIGGIIQSHVLHLFFLTLPEKLGKESAISMVESHKEIIEIALRLKRLGNQIVSTIAGRDVHPIAAVVGGFSRMPIKSDLVELKKLLRIVEKDAKRTLEIFEELDWPVIDQPVPHISICGDKYFACDKVIKCEDGACYPVGDYEDYFKEYFKKSSTAEYVKFGNGEKSYLVGALSRVLAKRDLLSSKTKKIMKKIEKQRNSPFMINLAQAVEIFEGVRRAKKLFSELEFNEELCKEFKFKKSEGVGAIEAPRGVLFHKYKFDKNGYCIFANITTPTSQNLENIEVAIKTLLSDILYETEESIKRKVSELIRSYDPCISCATHSLELVWKEVK